MQYGIYRPDKKLIWLRIRPVKVISLVLVPYSFRRPALEMMSQFELQGWFGPRLLLARPPSDVLRSGTKVGWDL